MSSKNIFKFEGKTIEVFWDKRLCIYIEECVRAHGDLFVSNRKPWCQPDLATEEEVDEIIKRCPTGSLFYKSKEGKVGEKPNEENSIFVTYKGPYFVRGRIELENAPKDMEGVSFRAALCRCGGSANKPFCDNHHEKIDFRDYGAVGQKGDGCLEKGGLLKIFPKPNGSLRFSGNISIYNGSGRLAWQGTFAGLCRCGESRTKPFCDGNHKNVGFKSE